MIDAVFDRLDWADKQIEKFVVETTTFLSTKPYALVSDVDKQAGYHLIRFKVVRPDHVLALRASDCLHHLRSALDNVAWGLALLYTSVPWKRTQFPIFDEPSGYKTDGLRQIQSIDPSIWAHFEEVQPYERRPKDSRSDLLWVLHALNIIDKHRRLNIIAGGPVAGTVRIHSPRDFEFVDSSFSFNRRIAGCYKDGAEVEKNRIRVTGPYPHVDVDFKLAYDIFIDEIGPVFSRPAWELLLDLRDQVRGIVMAFSRFF